MASMKTIQFRRHSIKQGPGDTDLSEEGIKLAEEIGRRSLQKKNFNRIFVSTLKRTQDTAMGFMRGAGDFPDAPLLTFQPGVEVGGTKEALALWSGVCNRAEHAGEDMLQAALKKELVAARNIATQSAISFKKWLASLPDETRTLVVGHSPFMELMVYGLFEEILPQLDYCEGFEITAIDEKLHLSQCDALSMRP